MKKFSGDGQNLNRDTLRCICNIFVLDCALTLPFSSLCGTWIFTLSRKVEAGKWSWYQNWSIYFFGGLILRPQRDLSVGSASTFGGFPGCRAGSWASSSTRLTPSSIVKKCVAIATIAFVTPTKKSNTNVIKILSSVPSAEKWWRDDLMPS